MDLVCVDNFLDNTSEMIEVDAQRRKRAKLQGTIIAVVTATILAFTNIPLEPPRIGNSRNSRPEALQYVRSWDDDMFRRQFRLCREDFGDLLSKIAPLIERNEAMARKSSGSSICPELRLMITLRILAGEKYLDMIWYRVSVDHVHEYVEDCLMAINSMVDNIRIPVTNEEWRVESEKFRAVLTAKHGSMGDEMLGGICGAGDGFVIPITEPVKADLEGRPSKNYMNRKGFFALLVQAFCGAHTNFWYFKVGWPGATNDITAYKQTELHKNSTNRLLATSIPNWVSFVLDEAYSSVGGCHLTPFTSHQLQRAFLLPDRCKILYLKMRSFNHTLSSQRITIERAFGQLVRRWGILWCANSSRLKNVSLMVQCCAKLHNVCVDRWLIEGRRGGIDVTTQLEIVPEQMNMDDLYRPDDDEVAERLTNRYTGIGIRAARCDLRVAMMEMIFGTGLRIVSAEDLIGLPSVGEDNDPDAYLF